VQPGRGAISCFVVTAQVVARPNERAWDPL